MTFYGASRAYGYLPALILELCDKGNVTEYLKGFEDGVAKIRTQERMVSMWHHPSNPALTRRLDQGSQQWPLLPSFPEYCPWRLTGGVQ